MLGLFRPGPIGGGGGESIIANSYSGTRRRGGKTLGSVHSNILVFATQEHLTGIDIEHNDDTCAQLGSIFKIKRNGLYLAVFTGATSETSSPSVMRALTASNTFSNQNSFGLGTFNQGSFDQAVGLDELDAGQEVWVHQGNLPPDYSEYLLTFSLYRIG